MNEDETLQQTPKTVGAADDRISPYNLLLRQSLKMGSLATRTYNVTKEFLKKDVQSLSPKNPDSVLFGKKINYNEQGVTEDEANAVNRIVKQSHEVLAGAKTVPLPVNLFPDSIIVDRTKVTITIRTFFWTSKVVTMRIEDILSVTSSFGPFFGSLMIATRIMNSTDHFEVNYFWRKDAEYLKQMIQGYVIAQHNSIETKHLSKQELIDTLLELGRDSSF